VAVDSLRCPANRHGAAEVGTSVGHGAPARPFGYIVPGLVIYSCPKVAAVCSARRLTTYGNNYTGANCLRWGTRTYATFTGARTIVTNYQL